MSFKLFGVWIEISVPFAVMIAFLLIMDKTGLMSASLLAVVCHEVGHLAAMKVLKCSPCSIKLSAAGILISGSSYCTAKENILVSLSGPFANIITFALFFALGKFTGVFYLIVISAVQLIVGLMNLLPIIGLDGGTVLYILLSKSKRINARLVAYLISVFTAFVVTVLGAAVAIKNVGNPSLLLLGVYLIILNIIKR